MGSTWLWLLAACAIACVSADREGSSLRGAMEALQRRQRAQDHGPVRPQPDYDALYEFVPPQTYPEPDYSADIEDIEEEPSPKYLVKFLEQNQIPPEYFNYKLFKKKYPHVKAVNSKKESAFRERTHHSDNEKLRDLFTDKNEADNKNQHAEGEDNDEEYTLLLGHLWRKFQNNREGLVDDDSAPQGVVKLYKEKIVKKRNSDNWGPIAFKRKRSPDTDIDHAILPDYDRKSSAFPGPVDPNYNAYDISDDDKDELREEYAIAFQPLDDDSLSDLVDEDQLAYDTVEKRFPVTKRSLGHSVLQKKSFVQNRNKLDSENMFRSSAGTDPKIIEDLSKVFGDSGVQIIKTPVKRSSDHKEGSHEGNPPAPVVQAHNHTHVNSTVHDDESHEHHAHSMHHPGLSGKEIEPDHQHHDHEHHQPDSENPINIKKKSINWHDYVGIDKRETYEPVNDAFGDWLKKQYYDSYNKALMRANLLKKNAKRNYVQAPSKEDTEYQTDKTHANVMQNDEKQNTVSDNDSKLDSLDKKLKTMEGLIVEEALHYSNVGKEVDSKEEQDIKEKLLTRLAAAYSLEKMRKALKEFKQALQTHNAKSSLESSPIMIDNTNDAFGNWLRTQYFDTFNKVVLQPLNLLRKHNNVKRNYVHAPSKEDTEYQTDRTQKDDKRNPTKDNESKLDSIDKKLKTMEGLIVEEALHYSNVGEELDSKEEQEMKEKLLSRLAAAYSLEKMRKALKEFKQSLETQKAESTLASSPIPADGSKSKRVAVKKELVFINETPTFEKGDRNYDFEDEQGAGHYLNGKIEEQFSEGYMGGSGRHRIPVISTASATGSCPVLGKIIQRCRGVDLLAGDRGQLFLPLCSLHQICYLCGEAPPTTCDLVFLSEADTTCEGDTSCQRAARSALMALRELHDTLADELDGECEISPCLSATLKLNIAWQRALLR